MKILSDHKREQDVEIKLLSVIRSEGNLYDIPTHEHQPFFTTYNFPLKTFATRCCHADLI